MRKNAPAPHGTGTLLSGKVLWVAWCFASTFFFFLVFLLHRFIRIVPECSFQFHAWCKGYTGFYRLRLESFFRQRTLARERQAHRAEIAQLHAETVAQVVGQTVDKV